jgi:serine O-acetyltransferase
MDDKLNQIKDACSKEEELLSCYRKKIPEVADAIIRYCEGDICFTHVDFEPIPSRDSVVAIIDAFREVIFPGYFSMDKLDPVNLKYAMGQSISQLFDMISQQVTLAIRHDCFRYNQTCSRGRERGYEVALDVIKAIPELRKALSSDVRATFDGDPAAQSFDEIIFSYPGIYAIMIYRLAHRLYALDVPLVPRIMSEYAHSLTGIDIHPGATIGERFVIDHGTGVVVGETTLIGDNVRIYQGVTLGALSLPRDAGAKYRKTKRHPTIEDNVIIYSGATILGGDTVIGANATIGGNVWLTESVPPDTTVLLETPKLVYRR